MKVFTYSVATTVLLLSTLIANSQDFFRNWYFTGDAGVILQQAGSLRQSSAPTEPVTFDTGLRIDAGLGYRFCDSFSAELEAGFMENSVNEIGGTSLSSAGESIELYSVPIIASLVYKVPTKCGLIPYVGVGGGGVISFLDAVPAGNNDSDFEPAFQAEAGLRYRLTPNATIGLGYKFLAIMDERYYNQSFNDQITFSGVYVHGILLNLSINF